MKVLLIEMKDKLNIIVIKIDATDDEIEQRFINRGDDPDNARIRIENDKELFRSVDYNYLIYSNEAELYAIICTFRNQ